MASYSIDKLLAAKAVDEMQKWHTAHYPNIDKEGIDFLTKNLFADTLLHVARHLREAMKEPTNLHTGDPALEAKIHGELFEVQRVGLVKCLTGINISQPLAEEIVAGAIQSFEKQPS